LIGISLRGLVDMGLIVIGGENQGPPGPQGPQGPAGAAGAAGEPGERGSTIQLGADPEEVTGALAGDLFILETNGLLYQYDGSQWVNTTIHVKGSRWYASGTEPADLVPGDVIYDDVGFLQIYLGEAGFEGIGRISPAKWYFGTDPNTDVAVALDGDLFVVVANGDVFQYSTDNGWAGYPDTPIFNLKGPQGDPGEAGSTGPQGPAGANGTDATGPDGGTTRQVLAKTSNADGDYDWFDNDYVFSGSAGLRLRPADGSFYLKSIYIDDGRYSTPPPDGNVDLTLSRTNPAAPFYGTAALNFMIGGYEHRIGGSTSESGVMGGRTNKIEGGQRNFIMGGDNNTITGGNGNYLFGCIQGIVAGSSASSTVMFTAQNIDLNSVSGCTVLPGSNRGRLEEQNSIVAGSPANFSNLFTSQPYAWWFKISKTRASLYIGRYVNFTPDGTTVNEENTVWFQTTNSGAQSNAIGFRAGTGMTTKIRLIMPNATPGVGQELRVASQSLTSGIYETTMEYRYSHEEVVTDLAAGTTIDWNKAVHKSLAITADRTVTFSNAAEGKTIRVFLKKSGGGADPVITFPTSIFNMGSSNTVTLESDKLTMLEFTQVGSDILLVSKIQAGNT
jgi:hypothetical protein